MNDKEFLHDVIFATYLRLLGKERKRFCEDRRQAKEFQKMKDVVKVVLKLEDDTLTSGFEWLSLYKDLRGVFERSQWKSTLPPYRSFRELVDTAAEQYPYGGPAGSKEEYCPVEEDGEDLSEECRVNCETALRKKIRVLEQALQKLKGGGSLDDRGNYSCIFSKKKQSRTTSGDLLDEPRGHFERTHHKVMRKKKEFLHQEAEKSRS